MRYPQKVRDTGPLRSNFSHPSLSKADIVVVLFVARFVAAAPSLLSDVAAGPSSFLQKASQLYNMQRSSEMQPAQLLLFDVDCSP